MFPLPDIKLLQTGGISVLNEFSRTELLIGAEGIEKLKNSHVAVFGIGLSDWLSVVSALGWVIAYVLLMHHWRSRWEGRFALSARKVYCQAEEQDSDELSIE